MDAFPDYTKFDPTKKVLCSIQVIGADDNFDKEAGLENEGTLARYNYSKDVGENNSYLAYGRKTNDDTDKDGKAEGDVWSSLSNRDNMLLSSLDNDNVYIKDWISHGRNRRKR